MFKTFPENKAGRDFFVGDIHGCFYKLYDHMNAVDFDEKTDRIFSVGDLVDRGTESLDAIDWIFRPYFHAVRGNHEDLAIRYVTGRVDSQNYERNGGDWMIKLPTSSQLVVSESLSQLPLAMQIATSVGTIGVVHAEAFENSWPATVDTLHRKIAREQILWGRTKMVAQDATPVSGIDYLVVGHTTLKRPVRLGNVFYIDTGACYGRELTMLTTEKLLEVQPL